MSLITVFAMLNGHVNFMSKFTYSGQYTLDLTNVSSTSYDTSYITNVSSTSSHTLDITNAPDTNHNEPQSEGCSISSKPIYM